MSMCWGKSRSSCALVRSLLFSQLVENEDASMRHWVIARSVRCLLAASALLTAKCKLCPKQLSHGQFNFVTAALMLAPLSVVIQDSLSQPTPRSGNAQ